VLKIEQLITRL